MNRYGKLFSLVASIAAFVSSGGYADNHQHEYHGYMRSGIGYSEGGTDQVCFNAPGTEGSATGTFRLGNECDTYVETSLVNHHRLEGSNGRFTTNFRLAFQTAADRDWEPSTATYDAATNKTTDQFRIAFREAYAQGYDLFSKDGAKPWVGKRFYRRIDIHLLDYYVVDNSGPGAGIEDIGVGIGKLHTAVTRNLPAPASGDGPAQTNIDLRLSDIETPFANLEVILIHGLSSKRGNQTGTDLWEPLAGTQVGLFRYASDDSGSSMVGVQYGVGLFGANAGWGQSMLNQNGGWGSQMIAKGSSDALDARKKSSTLRITSQLVKTLGPVASSFVLLYQNVDFGGAKESGEDVPDKSEMTIGARPVYNFNDWSSVALEVGHTSVTNGIKQSAAPPAKPTWKNSSLQKVTLAPQITAGSGFWARPSLRLFATYAKWNDDAKGSVGAPRYANATSGMSYGAQVESWW